jgi:hypothetical protein
MVPSSEVREVHGDVAARLKQVMDLVREVETGKARNAPKRR